MSENLVVNMKLLYFPLIFLPSLLVGDTNPDIVNHKRFQETNQRWEKFQDEISWFLDYIAPSQVEENDFTQKWKDEHEQTVTAIQEAQKAFLDFREKMARALGARFDQERYGASVYAISILDITNWYTRYMEKNLFPSGWQILYQKHLKEKDKHAPTKIKR